MYKPKKALVDEGQQARYERGNQLGDLAMQLFSNFKEAHAKKADGSLDLSKMVENEYLKVPARVSQAMKVINNVSSA